MKNLGISTIKSNFLNTVANQDKLRVRQSDGSRKKAPIGRSTKGKRSW